MTPAEHLKGMTLLYVEDEDVARMAVGAFLKRQVGTLLLAKDGQDGLEQFQMHHPDIVVSDLEMPVMNGMQMVHKMRELDNGTPIIITTAYDDEAHACPEADRVIIKPIMFNDLLASILDCIAERAARAN
ncbi:MAG: response regulator [Geobacter sp.]|nr:response regulator [Trichlorobacter sp.]